MADTNNSAVDSLRAEIETIRGELREMAAKAEVKQHELLSKVTGKMGQEWAHYSGIAKDRGGQLLQAGEAGLDEVSTQIRQHPLTSMAIAFGVGVLLSSILRR